MTMNVLAVLLVCRFLFFCTLLLGLFFLAEETSSGPGTTADAGRFIHDEDSAAGSFMALDFSGLGQHPSFLLGAHAFSKSDRHFVDWKI